MELEHVMKYSELNNILLLEKKKMNVITSR